MGGTSTDVSHYAGEFERAFETQVAGVRVRAPMMAIHTVAAGGGSILGFDGARFRVGPQSAGANPGPACYRRGGPLAVTDANVVLGKIQPAFFPRVFGPARRRAARRRASSRALRRARRARSQRATGSARSPEQVAAGFIDIAVGGMANAIKKISVARGYDVTRYTLQCFGGAGGQHACRVADALGMSRVFIHPLAGVLSAYGMGLADQTAMRQAAIELPLADGRRGAGGAARRARRRRRRRARAPGRRRAAQIVVHRRVHLRYEGTDSALVVPFGDATAVQRGVRGGLPAALRLPDERAPPDRRGGLGRGGRRRRRAGRDARTRSREPAPAPVAATRAHVRRRPLARRGAGRARRMRGRGRRSTARRSSPSATRRPIVEPGWRARDHRARPPGARADRRRAQARRAIGTTVDPVLLEVFNNLFMNIAEQMGLQLQNTAYSVNIKERLDFSCALFDAEGNLIANAPHMPVHLGSMSESIKTVIARNAGTMRAGDVYVLNDPYHGGTHLPDVTVVTPVYLDEAESASATGADVLRRLARPSRRHRRHDARLDAAVLDPHRGGGRAVRQRQARVAAARFLEAEMRAPAAERRAIRRATRSRTSPT